MNNPFVAEQAAGLARRVRNESPDSGERVHRAVALAWGRAPTEDEVSHWRDYLTRYSRELTKFDLTAEQVDMETWTSLAKVLMTANEFIYID